MWFNYISFSVHERESCQFLVKKRKLLLTARLKRNLRGARIEDEL